MQALADIETEAANSTLQQYGSKPKKPGLYLELSHGRRDPREQMSGWGFDGPAIGPLKWYHTTYVSDIKIEFENAADAVEYFCVSQAFFELPVEAGLLVFGGMYYGDWTVYYISPEDCEWATDTFRETTRENNVIAHRKLLL